MPEEFFQPDVQMLSVVQYWPVNWEVALENSMDAHVSYLHRNAGNFKEILTDLRLMVTAGPQAAAARAQSRRPSWHRLPYGIPLCLGFVGTLAYFHWLNG